MTNAEAPMMHVELMRNGSATRRDWSLDMRASLVIRTHFKTQNRRSCVRQNAVFFAVHPRSGDRGYSYEMASSHLQQDLNPE